MNLKPIEMDYGTISNSSISCNRWKSRATTDCTWCAPEWRRNRDREWKREAHTVASNDVISNYVRQHGQGLCLRVYWSSNQKNIQIFNLIFRLVLDFWKTISIFTIFFCVHLKTYLFIYLFCSWVYKCLKHEEKQFSTMILFFWDTVCISN